MKLSLFAPLSVVILALLTSACLETTAPTQDITARLTQKPEVKRLRFFREVNFADTRDNLKLTGSGVRVTVMGEAVDVSHTDLKNRVVQQYNTFVDKNNILAGINHQPYGFNNMGHGDGHGTHIAGTIAANCDGVGIQGIACGATLDVYDIGSYDNTKKFQLKGWGETNEFARFLTAFAVALDDVTRKGKSKITTGSFNMESPLIYYQPKILFVSQ